MGGGQGAAALTQIGEAFVGEGAEAAHVNTVLGVRGGPVEAAWATALATPSFGHAAFVAVVRPGMPVKPPTLFVNKSTIGGEAHARITWGAAQAGVASGVLDAVAAGFVPANSVDELVLIAAVWVDPEAADEQAVYENNRAATTKALEAGMLRLPTLKELAGVRHAPHNPFFTPKDSDPGPTP
jgi:5,6,7,8-tetrahydromethanopterin hydro-lyase